MKLKVLLPITVSCIWLSTVISACVYESNELLCVSAAELWGACIGLYTAVLSSPIVSLLGFTPGGITPGSKGARIMGWVQTYNIGHGFLSSMQSVSTGQSLGFFPIAMLMVGGWAVGFLFGLLLVGLYFAFA